ncbi:hypothetical protein DCC39_18610 [Pueribacillus theae]|uniref:NfeD-like C-terminal domain-containing protein n=1 Tax=Pueribacillus theae TaxID=2171751 RepID=A0A2U1JI55_9BACI|nr:NfeD family protein [Pueribacillus theae]PWA04817.1 hypothetical protein DCC39_18610 [Pueribacillus theae]
MEIVELPMIGFLVIMFGSLFLFGELFVKAKGIFFIVGIGLFTLYFSHFLTSSKMLWLAIVFLVGLFFIILDGAIVNDGSVTLIGLAVMALSVAVPAPSFLYGFIAVFALFVGFGLSLLFLKVMRPRKMWQRMALKDKLTSDEGYNSVNEEFLSLVGKEGVTATAFRPIGNIEVEGKKYSAITEGQWLEKGVEVTVDSVDGTKIVIKPKKK